MKKKMAKASLIIMTIAFVAGFVLIFSSLSIGKNTGFTAMQKNGGHMDTNAYHRIIDTTADNYKTAGFVLSMVGGFGILLSGYALYREL